MRASGRISDSTRWRYRDNTVHDLVAISNDLRRHIGISLHRAGFHELRSSLAPLLLLVRDTGLPQGKLADALGVSAQAASQAIGVAQRAGYVDRVANLDDGRSRLVVLSRQGRRFVEQGAEAIGRREARYAAYAGAARMAAFNEYLARLGAELALPGRSWVADNRARRELGTVILLAERATDELRRAMVECGHDAIRSAHHAVLVHVREHGARASDIARARGVSRQAISSTIHELEQLGYLDRADDERDGRGVIFTLSRRGARLVDDSVRTLDAIVHRYGKILGPPSLATFCETARDLHHRIRLDRQGDRTEGAVPADGVRVTSRGDDELATIADDLRRWLGDGDATQLGTLLTRPGTRR